jgi:hypothetical protein
MWNDAGELPLRMQLLLWLWSACCCWDAAEGLPELMLP